MILDAEQVTSIRRRYKGTGQIVDLCDTVEHLRAELIAAAERIGQQSELLSKRAEKRAGMKTSGSGA